LNIPGLPAGGQSPQSYCTKYGRNWCLKPRDEAALLCEGAWTGKPSRCFNAVLDLTLFSRWPGKVVDLKEYRRDSTRARVTTATAQGLITGTRWEYNALTYVSIYGNNCPYKEIINHWNQVGVQRPYSRSRRGQDNSSLRHDRDRSESETRHVHGGGVRRDHLWRALRHRRGLRRDPRLNVPVRIYDGASVERISERENRVSGGIYPCFHPAFKAMLTLLQGYCEQMVLHAEFAGDMSTLPIRWGFPLSNLFYLYTYTSLCVYDVCLT